MRIEKERGEIYQATFNIYQAGTYAIRAYGAFPDHDGHIKQMVKKFSPGTYTVKLRAFCEPQWECSEVRQ